MVKTDITWSMHIALMHAMMISQLYPVQQEEEGELTSGGISWNGRPRLRRSHRQLLPSPCLHKSDSCDAVHTKHPCIALPYASRGGMVV